MTAFQGSLLDLVDQVDADAESVDGVAKVWPGPLGPAPVAADRIVLGHGAWVEHRPGWVRGADDLFLRLESTVAWQSERRRMYDKVLDVPRLVRFYRSGEPLPDPAVVALRDALTEHHMAELGEPFTTVGMCLYRDGGDSVAWHGDDSGRGSTADTMVAIVSLGSPRTLALRPRGGGRRVAFSLGHGDLLVMGGSCQRTWEHAVPKTARSVGPRISVQFRPRGVR